MERTGDKCSGKTDDCNDAASFAEENFYSLGDLFDFPELDDEEIDVAANANGSAGDPAHSSTVINSTSSAADAAYDSGTHEAFETDDQCPSLYVPQDDIADLEWHAFTNQSFPSHFPEAFSPPSWGEAVKDEENNTDTTEEVAKGGPYLRDTLPCSNKALSFLFNSPLPGRARSTRPRIAASNLSSRIPSPSSSAAASGDYCNSFTPLSTNSDLITESSALPKRRKSTADLQGSVRKCSHCETTKTPQWRTGPNGPKTLCNACGVRYKSGRLFSEYRPASSPTFCPEMHSNSHRKVMEIRRSRQVASQNVAGSNSPQGTAAREEGSSASGSEYPHCSFGHKQSYYRHSKQDYRRLI